jgi:two-component system sensor histidine kinase RegB
MSRAIAKDSPLREDVDLLVSQSERCREILARLSARPDEGDAVHARHSLSAMLDEVVFPRRDGRVRIEVSVAAKGTEEREPDLRRMPEIIYGLGNLVDNALDFARTKVEVIATWSADEIEIVVRDDGPGFTLGILTRLGEPYVSERSGDRAVRRAGMGLGFFIAKTLLEKSEARVNFRNRSGGGAMVRMRWRREALEAR